MMKNTKYLLPGRLSDLKKGAAEAAPCAQHNIRYYGPQVPVPAAVRGPITMLPFQLTISLLKSCIEVTS